MKPAIDSQFVSALLRGEAVAWPAADSHNAAQLLAVCRDHGVTGLLYYHWQSTENRRAIPALILEQVARSWRLAAAQELLRRRALEQLLNGLAERGVAALLMKGTALAYTHYPAPELRARADTDLLIRHDQLNRAETVLNEMGFRRSASIGGTLLHAQASWHRRDELGVAHEIDLHWRISNFPVFAAKLTFDELWPRAVAIPALGAHGHGLAPIHALLFACMHRLGHRQAPYYIDDVAHRDANRLIWLFDIFLLARAFDTAQWREFAALAREKGLQEVCLDGLNAAVKAFGAAVPAAVMNALLSRRQQGDIALAHFGQPPWRWELWQMGQLADWRQRLRFMREHLVPASAYMRQKYSGRHPSMLPFLYLQRAAQGLWKRL